MENSSGLLPMAAINGVLNLSVLDGWWPEGYNGKNGWAITAGEFYQHSELRETAEANQIYDLLEEEITELYYDRNEVGTPKGWVKMMKDFICSVCRKFNMNKVLREYADKLYLPAKQIYEELCRNDFQYLRDATSQAQQLIKYWQSIRFADFSTSADNKYNLIDGDILEAQCALDMAQVPADLIYVELCYLCENGNTLKTIPMKLKDRKGTFAYYECSLAIEGYGLQQINVRIKPANETLQDIYPELVKWAR
jgi:starch phosphorylase